MSGSSTTLPATGRTQVAGEVQGHGSREDMGVERAKEVEKKKER